MSNYEEEIQLSQYWLILKRRWLPASVAFVLAVATATIAAFVQKPVYLAEGKLIFRDLKTISGLDLSLGGLEALSTQDSPLDTEIEVVLSVPVLERTLSRLNLTNTDDEPLKINEFRELLTVQKAQAGDVINISYEQTDPIIAADVVNTLMEVYEDANVTANRREANETNKFISDEIPKAKARVEGWEGKIRRFKEANQIIAPQKEAEAAIESISELQERRTEALAKVVNARSQAASLKQQLNLSKAQAVSLTSLSQSTGVQEVLQGLQQAEAELAVARTQFTADHPNRIALENRVQALRSTLEGRVGQVIGVSPNATSPGTNAQVGQLQQELTAELIRLEAQQLAGEQEVGALTAVQDNYRERIETLPAIEQRLNELLRELEVSQQTYAGLLKKQQEIEVVRTQEIGNARILSKALVPEEPIGPRKLLFIAAGLLLGSLLGFGVAVLLDARDKSIKSLDEIKTLFSNFTMLGVIPAIDTTENEDVDQDDSRVRRHLVVKNSSNSPASEAFRMVQSNLKYLSSDKQLQIIAITSGLPGEGKSTVVANLALAMAELNQKVLLIDADLRRPVQHHTWDLVNRIGLSDVLVGQASAQEAIQYEEEGNVDILTAGVLPPNPTAILDSEHMVSLLRTFKEDYDLIVVDAPPLSVAADAAALSRMADGVLLVVRPGVAETNGADLSQEILKQPGHNFLGIIANAVTRSQNSSYSYYSYAYESANSKKANANVRR